MVMPYEVSIPVAFIEETRDAAAKKLANEVKKVSDAGVTVHSHLADTSAAVAVTQTAESVGADLIIVGTRGHTGVKHFVLGSVAERVVRHAHCPVLTIKADS